MLICPGAGQRRWRPVPGVDPNATPVDLAGGEGRGLNGVLRNPGDVIDAANTTFSDVKQVLPHGVPAAVTNASWGDPALIAGVLISLIGRLLR